MKEFQEFLDKNGIRHFSAKEVLFRGSSDERLHLNTDPPWEYWSNIIPTLKVLDQLRDKLNAPIQLLSIYRSPEYNRAIEGEKNSYHMRFYACDFKCHKGSPKLWASELRLMRSAGAFSGGIGTYPTFVHVDTRGYNANW